MALEGDLEDFSLVDMLRLLESGAKTGVLTLERPGETGLICLRDGGVSFAAAPAHGQPLGPRLVAEGIIAPEQLQEAVRLQEMQAQTRPDRRLAQVLVDAGFVEERTLRTLVSGSVLDAVFELSLWTSGTVRFDHDAACGDNETGVIVAVDAMLQEMARRLDEWRRIRACIPGLDTLIAIAPGPGERTADVHLSPAEWRVLSELHGGRTVGELIEATGADDFDMARTLYAMQVAGLVDIVGGPGSTA